VESCFLNKRRGHVLGLARAERPVFVTIAHGGFQCKKALRPSTTDYLQTVLNKPESQHEVGSRLCSSSKTKKEFAMRVHGQIYIFGKLFLATISSANSDDFVLYIYKIHKD